MIPTVYILDTLAMLTPEKLTEEEELSGQMSATSMAKTNSAIFKRIVPKLKAANIILFVINHINPKVDINPFAKTKAQIGWLKPDETLPGGNAGLYLANNLIRVDDGTKLKDSEGLGINGKIVEFTFIKSRSNLPGRAIPLLFTYDYGYDPILSLFIFLKSGGYIESKGAYMHFNNIASETKFTQKEFKERILTDTDFAEEFSRSANAALSTLLGNMKAQYNPTGVNSLLDGILNMQS
jgi:hypothetical protein